MRELYGISGRKGHGKDTFANAVRAANTNFHINHFAAELKRIAAVVFGLTHEQMYDPVIKEQPFTQNLDIPGPPRANPVYEPRSIGMDAFLDGMRAETGLDLQPAGKIATTPRELMQFIGTEYVRKANPNYWVEKLLSDVAPYDRALVPDTRFPNEAVAVHSVGGKVIKVVRIDFAIPDDEHPSESEIDKIEPDLLIGSATGNLKLPQRIAQLVASGDFQAALMYDYRGARAAIAEVNNGARPWDAASLLRGEGDKVAAIYPILEYYTSW